MNRFVGRDRYLKFLGEELGEVRRSGGGRFVTIRGRRRVGKTRLAEEFLRRARVASVFFTASRKPPARELAFFAEAVAASDLPAAGLSLGETFGSWEAGLALIAGQATRERPAVVVIDEFPYLAEKDDSVDASFQKAWDRVLRASPLLLVLIGSDVAMMEALTDHARAPLYQRPTRTLVVDPLTPRETAELLSMPPERALDAYLVAGGFPLTAASWRRGESLPAFLRRSLSDPTSPLIVTGERILSAEFPSEPSARAVIEAIGSGETTFTRIGNVAGLSQGTLNQTLGFLRARKRVIEAVRPLSLRRSPDTRYFVADPYLRFWLRFIGPPASMAEIDRGRGELLARQILARWPSYRGRAIEPIVREALMRLLPHPRLGRALHAGGFWNRKGDIEVDLVGVDDQAKPTEIAFIGSIKWRERSKFDLGDRDTLAAARPLVPGAAVDCPLVGVSRSGFDRLAGLDLALGPAELIDAWD